LIGTRTWGGIRGIRGDWGLLDGGYITVPEDAIYDLDSQWAIETTAVDPDIVVDDSRPTGNRATTCSGGRSQLPVGGVEEGGAGVAAAASAVAGLPPGVPSPLSPSTDRVGVPRDPHRHGELVLAAATDHAPQRSHVAVVAPDRSVTWRRCGITSLVASRSTHLSRTVTEPGMRASAPIDARRGAPAGDRYR